MTSMTSNQVYFYPKSIEFYLDDSSSLKQIAYLYNQFDFPIKYKILSTAPNKYTVTNPEGFIQPKSSAELVIKHCNSAFTSENLTDKLRIQIYSDSNAKLICKRDIPLYSIVSRKDHILSQMLVQNLTQSQTKISNSLNESFSSNINHPGSLSSFSYGNSLNDLIALNSSTNTTTSPQQLKANKLNQSSNSKIKSSSFYNSNQMLLYNNADNVNYLVIFIGLICLSILFLPLANLNQSQNDTSSSSSSYVPTYLYVSYELKLFCSFVLGMLTMVILKN